jgi:predicted MFS family arabinose efflux permease
MSLPQLDETRERWLLIVLMLVQFTSIVDFMIMMPLSPYLMNALDIGPAAFGALVSSYSLCAGLSALLAASLADRFDRRDALLVTYIGLSLATLACAFAPNYAALLVARSIAGVFGGVLGSISFAIVGDVIAPARRGRAMSMVMLGFSLAAVAGVPAGLFVAHLGGWRVPFVALSAICALVLYGAWRYVPQVKGHLTESQAGFIESYRELLSIPNHWRAFAVTALIMFSGFLVIPYIAPSLVSNVGLAPEQLGWIYLVGGAVTLISRPLIGGLTDKHPYAKVLAWLVVASFVPILLVTHTPSWGLLGQLTIAALFFMCVSGRFIPATALVTAATQMRLRGRMMAFNAAVQNFSSGAAAMTAGAMMQASSTGALIGYDHVGYLSCLVGLAAIWAARSVARVG